MADRFLTVHARRVAEEMIAFMIMESTEYSLTTLFEQLGLDGSEEGIARFVERHRPLAPDVPIAEAPFWSDSQAALLGEALAADGAWALPVDELDSRLR